MKCIFSQTLIETQTNILNLKFGNNIWPSIPTFIRLGMVKWLLMVVVDVVLGVVEICKLLVVKNTCQPL